MFTYYATYCCEYSDESAFVRVISTEPIVDVNNKYIVLDPSDRFSVYAPIVFNDERKFVPFITRIKNISLGDSEEIRAYINPEWKLVRICTSVCTSVHFTSISL